VRAERNSIYADTLYCERKQRTVEFISVTESLSCKISFVNCGLREWFSFNGLKGVAIQNFA
jgi:hypothetical protein